MGSGAVQTRRRPQALHKEGRRKRSPFHLTGLSDTPYESKSDEIQRKKLKRQPFKCLPSAPSTWRLRWLSGSLIARGKAVLWSSISPWDVVGPWTCEKRSMRSTPSGQLHLSRNAPSLTSTAHSEAKGETGRTPPIAKRQGPLSSLPLLSQKPTWSLTSPTLAARPRPHAELGPAIPGRHIVGPWSCEPIHTQHP